MRRFIPLVAALALLVVGGCARDAAPNTLNAQASTAEDTPTAVVVRPEGALEVVLPVDGMVCEGCESTIAEKLTALSGVVSCTASHTAKTATIVYDPTKVQPEALVAAIGETGYKARMPE